MKTFFFIFLCLILISCKRESKPQSSLIESVKLSDTTCLKEISEAKKEIENSKLTYCHYSGNIYNHYLAQAILREVNENTEVESPILYANKFMDELKEKSFYFIKEVTRNMIIEAEMYCELKP